jgi:predicted dehydrogenase
MRTSAGSSRRDFLRGVLAAAAAPLVVPGRVLGRDGGVAPSNRIVFGAIGVGNRSRSILPAFLSSDDIRLAAVSDCRADRLRSAKEAVDGHYGDAACVAYADFRELLARSDIDAVFIATGNRWHGLASMYAARAGKDIYCEKPVTLTIAEGRDLVETCRRFGTIYQAGTQRRATGSYRFAREMVRQGRIGKLHTVEMQVWTGVAVPHERTAPIPDGVDYDMWLGQVAWRPYVPARFNAWQYFTDTGEGVIVDMGCHYTDQMQWVLGTDDTGPVSFEGRGEYPDPVKFMSDTTMSGVSTCVYADGVKGVMYQRRGFADRYIRYIGDGGWIQVDDDSNAVTAEPASILRLRSTLGKGWDDVTGHLQNLVDCIRSRAPTLCNPEVAHRAQTIGLAMTMSMRLGRKLTWDPVSERFDDEQANRLLRREPRAPWRH